MHQVPFLLSSRTTIVTCPNSIRPRHRKYERSAPTGHHVSRARGNRRPSTRVDARSPRSRTRCAGRSRVGRRGSPSAARILRTRSSGIHLYPTPRLSRCLSPPWRHPSTGPSSFKNASCECVAELTLEGHNAR